MKIYIVFLGLTLCWLSLVGYRGDLNRYANAQAVLKEACEECAAGAALLLDVEEYGDGYLVFDRDACEDYANTYARRAVNACLGAKALSWTCELRFKDEKTNDFNPEEEEYSSPYPLVVAEIEAETTDLFSSPLLSVTAVRRRACYEYKYSAGAL